MMTLLNNQILTLERARKNYEKAFKEAERAIDNFHKADADLNLSRAEVEKQRMNMTQKSQQCEETKNEYANQLQRTNDLQHQHYHILMPDVFRLLQELDEKRIKNIKNFMIHSVDVERKVFPIINQCLDGIVNAAHQINEKEDTLMVIERYKSGYQPPGDIPFEDLSRTDSAPAPPPPTISGLRPEAVTVKGTMSAGRLKKRVGLFAIFGSNKVCARGRPSPGRKSSSNMTIQGYDPSRESKSPFLASKKLAATLDYTPLGFSQLADY
ncbi:Formin-binding protein 1 [Homalodisca vitripennis]|nr:Formin-binding protein 1 [Homalodisca vitripennis]